MDYIDLPDLPQCCQICQAAWPSKVVAVGLLTTSTLEVPPVVFSLVNSEWMGAQRRDFFGLTFGSP